jgi:hypothetical protein
VSDPSDTPPDTPDLTDAADPTRVSPDEPLQPPEHEVEGAVPPGYDWPTHGGYLGCLVATIAACPIVGFIAANVWALFHASRLAFPLFALLIVVAIAAVIAMGRLGWVLGKRFYRYYPQPHPTWGESDEVDDAAGMLNEEEEEGADEGDDVPLNYGADAGDTGVIGERLAGLATPDEPGA